MECNEGEEVCVIEHMCSCLYCTTIQGCLVQVENCFGEEKAVSVHEQSSTSPLGPPATEESKFDLCQL